ncbi:hypothetical protein [Actinomadura rugatobispora]|uniref:Exo-alpha-sialidase n=1 Tax=Actinomadura rugatobispora TaxID=1994 RepID=A0ABW0ZM62_9ACTN|nr:hypothetical protein GCM10010200_093360 [Actinomadura rugatobispora]
MAPAAWTGFGSPGEVTWARPAGDGATIAVGTAGGHLYLRRRQEAGWRWERIGTPPGALEVLDTALLAVEGSTASTPIAVGDDFRVWLHRPGTAATPWIGLDGPHLDEGLPFYADCGDIAVSTSRDGAELRHMLVVSSASGRPWIRQGIQPGVAWLRIASDEDNAIAVELATAFASVAPEQEPQPHIFAVAQDPESSASRLRVAVLENSLWTWIDLGGPGPGVGLSIEGLSATSIRDGGGRLQACAIVRQTLTGNVGMVIGSGRSWRWGNLLRPPVPDELAAAVVAAKGPDPRPGDEPVIVARAGHGIWTRSLTGGWTNLGTTPQDVAVVDPTAAFDITAPDGRRRVWATGVSWESDLWTFESDDTGVRWEKHGCPGSVVSVVGAHNGPPGVAGSSGDRLAVAYVVDEHGALWSCEQWGNPVDGFFPSSSSWTSHGVPAAGVTIAESVGVYPLTDFDPEPSRAFVVGSDGHLWARAVDGVEWTWVDHGAPTGRSVKSGVAPINTDMDHGPTVHVMADDGRLWLHAGSAGFWRWSDLGAPPGQLIFRAVGAATPLSAEGLVPAAAVITGDGHLWIHVTDVDSTEWSDLGTPAPDEKVIAGIGVEVVTEPPDAMALDIVVVGSPSGQVWSCRWARFGTSSWTAHGRPGDARIRGGIGTVPDATSPSGFLVSVIGNDQQVWAASSAAPGGAWTRWDPRSTATTIVGGKAAVLLDMPCGVLLDGRRRVNLVTPGARPADGAGS